MGEPAFVGVSTGRSGSRWIAEVMNRAGIACTHEQVFVAERFGPHGDVAPAWDRPELGEWSAQVVPLLDGVEAGRVWHQVRDPLRVVGSLMSFGLFQHPNEHGLSGKFIVSRVGRTGDPLADVVRYVADWLERCDAAASLRWRVEDVDADLLVRLGAELGVRVDAGEARDAVASVPTDLNTHGTPWHVDAGMLPDTADTVRLLAAGRRYGYAC